MAIVTSALTLKGGVGKTTLILNLIYLLKQAGHRVLAIDLDTQGNLTHALGGEIPEYNGTTYTTGYHIKCTMDQLDRGGHFSSTMSYPYGDDTVSLLPTDSSISEAEADARSVKMINGMFLSTTELSVL